MAYAGEGKTHSHLRFYEESNNNIFWSGIQYPPLSQGKENYLKKIDNGTSVPSH